jgi:hypothetical protein
LEPKEHLTKLINLCGVVARDNVSIIGMESAKEGTCWFYFCRQENEKGLLKKTYGTFRSTSGIQQMQ